MVQLINRILDGWGDNPNSIENNFFPFGFDLHSKSSKSSVVLNLTVN